MCKILRVTSYYKCMILCSMSRQAPSYRILKIFRLHFLRYQQRGKGFLIWEQSSDGGVGADIHLWALSWVTRRGIWEEVTAGRLEKDGPFHTVLWLHRTWVLSTFLKTFSPSPKIHPRERGCLKGKEETDQTTRAAPSRERWRAARWWPPQTQWRWHRTPSGGCSGIQGHTCWSYTWGRGRSSPGSSSPGNRTGQHRCRWACRFCHTSS